MSNNQLKPGQFCWNELLTINPEKAKNFYSDLLGWSHHDIDMDKFTYTIFKQEDKEICGMMKTPDNNGEKPVNSYWMSYILVDDVAETLKKAEKLGAKTIVPVTTVGDFGKLVIFMDPTGAQIALWQTIKKQ